MKKKQPQSPKRTPVGIKLHKRQKKKDDSKNQKCERSKC